MGPRVQARAAKAKEGADAPEATNTGAESQTLPLCRNKLSSLLSQLLTLIFSSFRRGSREIRLEELWRCTWIRK